MSTADDSHEFGSDEITEIKLRLVEEYIKAYTVALRTKFRSLWYIDAFAGTGSRTVRHEAKSASIFDEETAERIERRRGSARIALEVKPYFDKLIFMEQRKKHFDALMRLKDEHPDRDIIVLRGDANELIQREIASTGWARKRAVLFLDPYGMNVDWATLKVIANTGAIDVWYLFSIEGLYRQAARDISKIDVSKRAAITRQLGTDEWENKLYQKASPQNTLFGLMDIEDSQRTADVEGLERYVTERLRTLFPLVMQPYPLPLKRRPQRFSLYFALSNQDPKAIGLARRIAGHILADGNSSQVRSR
jgi:three-Cys-motif partner protein